jgi:hypothetical protein
MDERMKLTKNQFEGLTEAQMEWGTNTDWLQQKDRFEDCFTTNYAGSWVNA